MKPRFALLLLLVTPFACLGRDWYSAPTAQPGGDGSVANPWPLRDALTKTSLIQPGDTLFLRGGIYRGPGFQCSLSGTVGNYIVVRSYPGERAVLADGLVGILGTALSPAPTNTYNVAIAGFESLSTLSLFAIGSEFVYSVGRSGSNWNLVRGWSGTAITNHSPGELVTIVEPILRQTGSYVRFQDFEISAQCTTNRNKTATHYIPSGLDLSSEGRANKAVNLIIHDVGHPGVGFWGQGDGGEINGCIIWGVGQYDYVQYNGTARGSGVYSQNPAGAAAIRNCMFFRNFTTGAKVFGETGAVRDFYFTDNIVMDCPLSELEIASGSTSTSNTWMNGNLILGTPMLAYVSVSNTAQFFINNVVVNGSFTTKEHANSVYTNNTVLMPKGVGVNSSPVSYTSDFIPKPDLNITWDWNTYYLGDSSSPYQWSFKATNQTRNSLGGGTLKFDNDLTNSWRSFSGFDSHSSFQSNWPTNYLHLKVTASDYDTNRFHLGIVNTSPATAALLDLSSLAFKAGDIYLLHDAQNLTTVLASNQYSGGAIQLPLTLTNIAPVIGNINHFTNAHSNVKNPGLFNAFILQRFSPTKTTAIAPPTGLRLADTNVASGSYTGSPVPYPR
jgi:hypothetical protein